MIPRAVRGRAPEALETTIRREGFGLATTLHLPRTHRRTMPGWVAIGGMSRMGPFHPQLLRFADSLAASGAPVMGIAWFRSRRRIG